MVRYSGAGFVRALARKSPLWVVSVGLVTDDRARQFAQCAAGAFDGYFRQVGANLRNAGAQATVVRLGWEANSGTHAWGLSSSSQVPAYKACFRRAARALKAGGPGLLVEWTNAKKGKLPALQTYPGDDVVDLWGVHYYDTGPKKSTQAIWDQYVNATNDGNPWGIGAWLRAAQAHGKKLGVAEWGIWDQGEGAKADDPVYMDNMARFFRANAGGIAYETYFNTGRLHSAVPEHALPEGGGALQGRLGLDARAVRPRAGLAQAAGCLVLLAAAGAAAGSEPGVGVLLAGGTGSVLYGLAARLVTGVATGAVVAGLLLLLAAAACAGLGAEPTPARLAVAGLVGLLVALGSDGRAER